ncbi:hypothetical protein DL96DRAFT_1553290 [Flagelloscypha sp. PMI_526]|nr:hypothetical protein DL96DRAFT_1553290 [Flagelloscypha sp. PMI_526]
MSSERGWVSAGTSLRPGCGQQRRQQPHVWLIVKSYLNVRLIEFGSSDIDSGGIYALLVLNLTIQVGLAVVYSSLPYALVPAPCSEAVLELRLHNLGSEHPDTLKTMNNLQLPSSKPPLSAAPNMFISGPP